MSASIDSVRGLLLLVRRPGRALSLVAAVLGSLFYTWYAAVRAVPGVRRRKAAARARRRSWSG